MEENTPKKINLTCVVKFTDLNNELFQLIYILSNWKGKTVEA